MEKPDYLSPIIEVIQSYNLIDLLAKVGALQLYPENANHSIRLEAFSHAINCIKYEPNRPIITRHRLFRLCNEPPLGNSYIQSQEDPTPNAFTEAFTFFGGSYIVFPGQLSDPTFILQHLNAAIFLSNKFKPHKYFRNKIYGMNRSLLELSDIIATRAGLARNMPPKPVSEKIYIPIDIDTKKNAVVFSSHELGDILDSLGLNYSALEPFIEPFGKLYADSYSFQNSPLHSQPIIRFENDFIVSEPWILLASLRHHILLSAKEFGVLDLLVEEFQTAILHTVGSSLDRLGHKQIPRALKEADIKISVRESLWSLDTDKILYAAVITDNFTDYVGDELFEDHINFEEGEILDKHLTNVEQQIRKDAINLGDIFFLLINAGIGRSQIIGLQLDKLKQEPIVLMLSASDLEIISLLYISDYLVLYKFAKAQQSIRKTTEVFSWSTLDEFEIYRKNECSYYLDDGPRPSLINIAPGSERELKLEVLQKLDIHAVPMFESSGWVEVANVYHVLSCPIYTPINFYSNQIGFFVELLPVSFWVVAKIEVNQFEKHPDLPNPGIFVDLISYWIWQFGNELSKCLTGVDFDFPIVIDVKIDETEEWAQSKKNKQNNSPLSINIVSEYKIQITVKPAIIEMLSTADNFGELQVIKLVLHGFSDLLNSDGWIEQSIELTNLIPQFIEEQRSNPRKKKVIAINPNLIPTLLPGNLISFRKVQEADRSELLDDAGKHLQDEHHLVEGVIPKEQHVNILNSIVGYYFNKLSNIISNLNSEHLLDFLVTHYEAIISERINRHITIATQLACFSSVQELTQQLVEQLPEIDDAAISCRFLIEYVVVQPPKGKNPISLVVYDQMMALASEIISRGNQSDFAKYGLFDFDFNLLASGRLGFNRSLFNKRINTYQNARSKIEIIEAGENFPRWWKEKAIIDPNDYPPRVKELNLAFKAEFGLVFTDISRFISELGDLSMSMESSQLKIMELNALVAQMSDILDWCPEKVLSIINFLSLSPRDKFLEPLHPFNKADIYPWRMSRGLSYMRRPLLIVVKNEQTTVCWGVRHLFASLDYLLQATVSGRLQDRFQSKKMQEFLGKISTNEGEEFNNKVYQFIASLPGVIVSKKVKKVCGKRIGSPGNDFGDLDVLAFFTKSRTIAIIECKDLEIARNAIEMSREMEALFIGNAHSESTIVKHMRRVDWVKSNIYLVLESYGIKDNKKWKIAPLLVVSSEMITPHFYNAPVPVFSFSQFVSNYLPKHN